MAKKNPPIPHFEEALQQLEQIVEKMESGSLNLEQALQYFEQGITLTRQCQHALRHAEQRIQQLIGEELLDNIDAPVQE